VAALVLQLGGPPPLAAQAVAEATSAKTWLGRAPEIEEHIRKAKVVKLEDMRVGVTKPRHGHLAPGGPVDEIAWKTVRPGIQGGYWESYKSEIAAYELDKLLGLDMIPPTVEREIEHETGAAIMWVRPVKSFAELGGPPAAPPQHLASWNRQLVRAKMFDDLINNIDPNLGNWLVDPAWNLILIDHTRSFTPGKKMVHKLTRVDPELWEKMKGLTYEAVSGAVGKWVVGKGEIRAILERRDRMQAEIDRLVAENGEAAVFMK
jgi:hypothetical protein